MSAIVIAAAAPPTVLTSSSIAPSWSLAAVIAARSPRRRGRRCAPGPSQKRMSPSVRLPPRLFVMTRVRSSPGMALWPLRPAASPPSSPCFDPPRLSAPSLAPSPAARHAPLSGTKPCNSTLGASGAFTSGVGRARGCRGNRPPPHTARLGGSVERRTVVALAIIALALGLGLAGAQIRLGGARRAHAPRASILPSSCTYTCLCRC